MMSRAPFPTKLFHDPVMLKVTYIEVMGSIYIFSYSNVTRDSVSCFATQKLNFVATFCKELWKHLLNLYWSTTNY